MDIDLDDLISTDAANTAKAGIKFQPKGKPKPKPKPKPNAQPEPKSTPTPSTQLIKVTASTEEQAGNDADQITGNVRNSLQSSSEKSQGENAKLDSPNDFLPESTTTDSPNVDVSMDRKLEVGPTEPELINNIDASANLESIAELDPLTGEEASILNDNEDFVIGNLSPGSKEAENSLLWEPLNITGSGPRVSKFKPKPKAQSRKMEQMANNPDQDAGPVQQGGNNCSVPSENDFMEHEPGPSFTPDEILGTSSIRITDSVATETISDHHVNEEPSNLTETSQVNSVTGRSSERLTRLENKALLLIDEPENEIIDDDNNDDYVPENDSLIEKKGSKSKPNSKKPLNESKKVVRKRKKVKEGADELIEVPKKKFSHSTRRNKRQVNPELLKIPEEEFEMHMHNIPLKDLIRLREHKEKIEGKLSFLDIAFRLLYQSILSTLLTRRSRLYFWLSNRRLPQKSPVLYLHPLKYACVSVKFSHGRVFVKNAVMVFEKKEASLLGTDTTDQCDHAENTTYYNYRTHMKITPRMKWTKLDTELFYEAIQQFGTDLSIIKECFPGRTREQIRSKFKKEYKQNRLRIESALNTRAKGLSHFELVIERLKQARAEDSEYDEPANLTGEDDEVMANDINVGGHVELQKEEKDMEPDVTAAAAESPTKSNDIEEDDTWSQYKSDI